MGGLCGPWPSFVAHGVSWGRRFPFVVIGPLGGIAVRFGGSEKVFLDFDPYGGLLFYDRAFGLRASPTFIEPPPVAGVWSRIGSSLRLSSLKHFSDKNGGLSRAMIFLHGGIMVLGELIMR